MHDVPLCASTSPCTQQTRARCGNLSRPVRCSGTTSACSVRRWFGRCNSSSSDNNNIIIINSSSSSTTTTTNNNNRTPSGRNRTL